MTPGQSRSAAVSAATPAGRERYVDFVRALVVLVVVVAHWLAAVVTVQEGRLAGTNILAVSSETQVLTWVIQVLPVFFFVGGYANAASWVSTRERGGGWPGWIDARMRRLLMPAGVFLGIVVALAAAARLAGADPDVVRPVAHLTAFLLWFLAVYLPVVALTPVAVWAQERCGLAAVAALAVSVAVVDLLRLAFDVPGVGWLNFLLVYGAAAQLGIAWRRGSFVGPGLPFGLLVVGLGAAVALVATPAYPLSMVTVPGAGDSNASPPSLAFLLLGVAQAGLVLLLRDPGRRLCERPIVWTATVLVNSRIMTIYLWQMVPLLLGAVLLVWTGWFPAPPPGSAEWWALRPLWVAALAVLFLPIVVAAGTVEARAGKRAPAAPADAVRTVLAAAGVALIAGGLMAIVVRGPSTDGPFVGIPVIALLACAIGALAVRTAGKAGAPESGSGEEPLAGGSDRAAM